jgi:hypothetical protein
MSRSRSEPDSHDKTLLGYVLTLRDEVLSRLPHRRAEPEGLLQRMQSRLAEMKGGIERAAAAMGRQLRALSGAVQERRRGSAGRRDTGADVAEQAGA